MDGIPSISRPRRLCSTLLHALVLVVLGLPFPASAHVGIHEEIETLSHTIQKSPENSQLYVSRGEAYRLHGNWERAITDFSKALDIDPENILATNGLGRTYLDKENPQQALVYLNRSLAREPGNVRALILRARAYTGIGMPLEAAADYTHAIHQSGKQGKSLPEYYLERAHSYAAAGDAYIDTALQGLDEGISVLGNIRTLELLAVELETERGNFDVALTRLDRILSSAARKEYLLLQRGDILTAADRRIAAKQAYIDAQAAIDTLPPYRRHTLAVRQLQADLDARLAPHGVRSRHD